MSDPVLIDVPTSSCFAGVTMTLNRVIGVTQSPFTLETQTFKWPGEQWSMQLQMPAMTRRAMAAEWYAFALKLEGTFNYFLMGDPSAKTPRGTPAGSPVVDGGGQQGNTLLTRGWTPNSQSVLMAGDYIQLGTGMDSRLHMVVDDADANGDGETVLNIVPALRTPPNDGLTIITNNAKGVFRLTDNSFSWGVSPGPLYRLNFDAVEVINA